MPQKRIPYPHPEQSGVWCIPLTQGAVALVDDSDLALVQCYSWAVSDSGPGHRYARASINGRPVYMHRLLAKPSQDEQVDHKNGDGLDNRRNNIRCCEKALNLSNRRAASHNTSGYKGVSLHKPSGRWVANVTHKRVVYHLGYFSEKEEAAAAYNEAASRLHGEFAQLNAISGIAGSIEAKVLNVR